MKPYKEVLTIALSVTLLFFLGNSIHAQGWIAAHDAGHRLCDLQADLSSDNAHNGYIDVDPDDGGWDWDIHIDTTEHSPENSPANTYGITGLGLLTYLEEEIAPGLTWRFITAIYDTYQGIRDNPDIDLAPDVVFCTRISLVDPGQEPAYAELGRTRYDARVVQHGSPLDLAHSVMQQRAALGHDGLVPWELGWLTQAALALDEFFPGEGYDGHALIYTQAMVDDINDPNGIFQFEDSSERYYTLGLAFLASTLYEMGIEPSLMQQAYIKLYYMQKSTGAFPWSGQDKKASHQTTAYAVRAFHKVKFYPSARASMRKGAAWLENDQEDHGGWTYLLKRECTQVDSEIMTAFALIKYWPSSDVSFDGGTVDADYHQPPVPHENATMIKP